MADIMVKILMKGAKAIGKTAVILIIWIAHIRVKRPMF